jgi:hypothetical protein
MTLRDLLVEKQTAVCGRWLDAVLAGYGELTAARWRREKDPFANPIGHALVTGLPPLLEAVIREGEPDARAMAALETLVRIRAVQDLAPSRAVGFVLDLREAIRQELAAELEGGAHAEELEEIEGRIVRLMLRAFDGYVGLREQVFRLRRDEMKRSVAFMLRHWHGDEQSGADPEVVKLSPPPAPGAGR